MKYTSVKEQVDYGLDQIDPEEKVEISLKDLMFMCQTFQELNRFFHQRMHYPELEDVHKFMGNKKKGAYSLIRKACYKVLPNYIPQKILHSFGTEADIFTNPNSPYYCKEKKKKE